MSNLVLVVWFVLLLTFAGFSGLYYLCMRHFSLSQWNVKRDKDYRPMVTILIPAHNEEKVIGLKLKNLMKLDYPKNKLQIIVIDDGSTDNTVREIREFQKAGSGITVEKCGR
jgi:cellulose synthase/poly-beta-1,6-N-acetylglucosamine synthase-like glycosyltransferase